MSVNVADRELVVLSSAICAQAIAVYEVLQRRLMCCDIDASFTPAVATTVEGLARRAEAEPWPVSPLVAERIDHILDTALHAEAPIAVASWSQTLPETVLDLLERRGAGAPDASLPLGAPKPGRRATDH